MLFKKKITEISKYSKEKSVEHGEVFTPWPLVQQMVDAMNPDLFLSKNSTFFDPSAGKGQMPAVLIDRLSKGLENQIPDKETRIRWILENQIYMSEFQEESCKDIVRIFKGTLIKLNLHCGDSLTIPEDFWDLSYEERAQKYWDRSVQRIISLM
jgi:hypothetical protein